MTDAVKKELLTLAAKAMGEPWASGRYQKDYGWWYDPHGHGRGSRYWNPRDDDADCAQMEAELRIDVLWYPAEVAAYTNNIDETREAFADHSGDRNAARRLASTRVAAEVGRGMKRAVLPATNRTTGVQQPRLTAWHGRSARSSTPTLRCAGLVSASPPSASRTTRS